MNTEENDPTLRLEEIAMAKMIRARALEIGNQKLAQLPLSIIVKEHRAVLRRLGMVRKT